MACEEILKVVFPLLDCTDLAKCMLVCKHWQEIAQDDYFWKCLCTKRWPSLCKRQCSPMLTYYQLFQKFYKRQHRRSLLPPRLSLSDLEFYIDIWAEESLIFSEVVPGLNLERGRWSPPPGICNSLKYHLEDVQYKMILPVEPTFTVPLFQLVNVSVLIGRKDSKKVACIIDKSVFDYIDRTAHRAQAFDYLDISPSYPFLPEMRAWISLLFIDSGNEGVINVFGIQLDFCDVANSEEEVLWLLDMLDWK